MKEREMEILAKAVKPWTDYQSKKKDNLYHYTTAQGLRGILSDNCIWATKSNYLTDKTELNYGRELIREGLKNRPNLSLKDGEGNVFPHPQKTKLNNDYFLLLQFFINNLFDDWDFYVSSFCEDGDLLSQWRGYGESGGGYAVGFKTNDEGNESGLWKHLFRVLYKEHDQRQIISNFFVGVTNLIDNLVDSNKVTDMASLTSQTEIQKVLRAVNRLIVSFKHPKFEEEKEWRIVHTIQVRERNEFVDQIKLRTTHNIFIPYVELRQGKEKESQDPKLPLQEIVIGPQIDPTDAVQSVEFLKLQTGYKDVSIKLSEIPFGE